MRVGLVIYGSLDTLSGGYLYDRKLVEFLRAQGDHVEIVSIPWRNYFSHLWDNLSSDLLSRLNNIKADILLQDELNHPSLFWINQKLKKSNPIPIISIVHHLRCSEQRPAWQNSLYAKIEQQYLASLDGFIFNSQATQDTVKALVGSGEKFHQNNSPSLIAYPAGDRFDVASLWADKPYPEFFTQRANETGPLRLLFAGNVIYRKGLHTVLAALNKLPVQDFHLDVAGSLSVEPAYTRRVMDLVQQMGLAGTVQFHGPLNDDHLQALFSKAQVLVNPSSYEGFGIVYLEGMSFGLPAVASTAGAAREIIDHTINGYLIEPGDVNALARILKDLAANRLKLAEMAIAARRRFETFPTWRQSAAAIREFLIQQTFKSGKSTGN